MKWVKYVLLLVLLLTSCVQKPTSAPLSEISGQDLQSLINEAPSGSTILLESKRVTLRQTLLLEESKHISLEGRDVVIVCKGKAPYFKVEGTLTVKGVHFLLPSDAETSGVAEEFISVGGENAKLEVSNCRFTYEKVKKERVWRGVGIAVTKGAKARITDCLFENLGSGVNFTTREPIFITKSTFRDNFIGAELYEAHVTLKECCFEGSHIAGVIAVGYESGRTMVFLSKCRLTRNNVAIMAQDAYVFLDQSTLSKNGRDFVDTFRGIITILD